MTGVKRLRQAKIAVTLGISVRQLQRLEAELRVALRRHATPIVPCDPLTPPE